MITLALILFAAFVIGMAILYADGRAKIRDAREGLAQAKRDLDALPPLPTYEPSQDAPFSAGDETDIQQALRLAADSGDPDAQTVDRIRERVMDEIHARRLQRDPIRWLS